MAKLFLKFEQAVLKEFSLAQGVVTIGRLPDNLVQVDNLAVSGHHAKIYWDNDHYVLEDNNSLNGTYVNNQRVSKVSLKDGDQILIGKHVVQFEDAWHEDGEPAAEATVAAATMPVPKLDMTVMVTGKKVQELLQKTQPPTQATHPGAPAGAAAAPAPAAAPPPPAPGREQVGLLTVVDGKTDMPNYRLTGKLTVIGKSDMATIKLKGWFAPKVAAAITKREGKYFIASQDKATKVHVGGSEIAGQKQLNDGDLIEIAGVKMTFSLEE